MGLIYLSGGVTLLGALGGLALLLCGAGIEELIERHKYK